MRMVGGMLRGAVGVLAAVTLLASFAWFLTRPLRQERLAADQVQLTVLHWGDKNEDRIVADLVADFERQHRDIRIVRTNVGSPARLATKLQTMLAAGDPPDVFYLESERLADLASKGLLADIEALIRADQNRTLNSSAGPPPNEPAVDLDDFFTPVVDAFRFDGTRVGRGTLFGLPKDFTTVGFYYNKDLFRRAGVPSPPADEWTWEQFIAAARAIGKLPGCYGADFVTWEAMVRIYLFTHGVDFTEPGFETFRFDDPDVRAAIERLRGWFHEEDRTLLSAKTQLETGQEPFLAGNVGLAGPFGRWKVPTYRRIDKFDWDFAPLPHAAGQPPANGVLTVAWAMSAQNRHPQASWRLIKYLCGRRGQELICAQGLAIPVLKSVARSRCFSDPDRQPANDAAFLEAAERASYIEWPADPRYRDQLKTHLEEIFKLGRPVAPKFASVQRAWESNATPTVFRADYREAPWGAITAWILLPLAALIAATAALWWRRRPGSLALREELAGMAMVSPWVVGFLAITAFPVVLSLLLAFTRWSGMLTLDRAEWVGLDNFRELVGYDATFRRALVVTALYALLAVPSSQVAALIAALLLNREVRGIGVFRAIWYLPSVLAGVGMAIMWKWVFHHEHGLLNILLEPLLGLFDATPPRWFERDAPTWGVPAFAMINLWVIGGTMMIYLAGLKGVPAELYEAAEIDGATGRRRFLNVTLPMLSPVIFFNVIIAIIASFQIFTQVFVMTGGGPGTATHFYVYYIYKKAFDLHDMGYASAMAWLLLIIVLVLTLLVMRGSRRYVYYEALKA
jgi:multiple sugar transport system permease protein